MSLRQPAPDFIRRQYAFAGHIRDPEHTPVPNGVDERRMAIYRELFFNNIEGFLASGFPVIHRLLEGGAWSALVRDFLIRHRCRSPHFPEIAEEFLHYLEHERGPHRGEPPFLRELAHYEWVELALGISDADEDLTPLDREGDLLQGIPVVSPLAWSLSYAYRVHRISPECQPQTPGDTPAHLVAYRHREDPVRFLEINSVTRRLLELLKENTARRGLDILNTIAEELGATESEGIVQAGAALLADLRHRGIVLGIRAA